MSSGEIISDSLCGVLKAKRDQLIAAWSEQTKRSIASAALPRAELLDRMPQFVDQIIAALYPEAIPLPAQSPDAEEHGAQRLSLGFDVGEVIQEYGLLHQCILQIAAESGLTITLREQEVVAKWLNSGIADAIAQYVKQRDLELQRRTSEHLGFIAHELRNPLATTRSAFERLRKAELQTGGRWVDVLDRNLRRTVDLIDGVLGQASLEMGIEPLMTRIDVRLFLREIELDTEIEARSRSITVKIAVEEPLEIDADPRLLRSAVSNLLHNALKFSRSQSTISVSAGRAGDRMTIEVADGCGGLPPGKAEELFTPLVQRGENRSGFGLGLAIALQAAQAHHGTVKVRDCPGIGCVFTIDLPLGLAARRPSEP